jgi:hypothetical protein
VRAAIRLKSVHADALTQLGMLLEARHDHERALKHYEAVSKPIGSSRAPKPWLCSARDTC